MEFQLTLREGLVSDVIRAIRDWGMTVSVDDVLIVMEGGNLQRYWLHISCNWHLISYLF